MIKENVYGNAKRLKWILPHIRKDLSIIELGCGTGYMICLPLKKMGYSI
jgi:ubiquinone/menaquinone biosynthesis C-methylase UbiE